MQHFTVPARGEVSANNQVIFDNLQKGLGFVPNLYALAKLTQAITESKGRPDANTLNAFFDAGYTRASLIDLILAVADKVVMNYVHNITQIPIDFPVAPELEAVAV